MAVALTPDGEASAYASMELGYFPEEEEEGPETPRADLPYIHPVTGVGSDVESEMGIVEAAGRGKRGAATLPRTLGSIAG